MLHRTILLGTYNLAGNVDMYPESLCPHYAHAFYVSPKDPLVSLVQSAASVVASSIYQTLLIVLYLLIFF